MPLSVTCACGKRLQIKESLAGKRIRCPQCQEVLTVPALEPAPKMPAAGASGKAGVRSKQPSEQVDDEAEEEEQRLGKGKKKGKAQKSSANLVLLLGIGGGGALLVLVGGVVAVLLVVNSQSDPKKPGPQAGANDGQKGDKQGSPEEKKWIGDPEKEIIGKWRHDGMFASKIHLDHTLEFLPDGTFNMTTGGEWTYTNGKWKQTAKSGNAITVLTNYDSSFKFSKTISKATQTFDFTVENHNLLHQYLGDKKTPSSRWKRIE